MDAEPAASKLLSRLIQMVAGRGNRFRTLFVLLLACNWKNLPFVWHYRFFNALLEHVIRPRAIPRPSSVDEAYPLFLPVITSTCSPMLECDYNIHKSNSTYFSDLDVSRTHLTSLLCAPGLAGYRKRVAGGEQKGNFNIALGGVACFFQREIKPYERYELWTRVLSWDRKWVYVVTHFVKKDAVVPSGYIMQPNGFSWWPSWMGYKKGKGQKSLKSEEGRVATDEKKIFAFALSKYVFKSGRITIPPEKVFEDCEQMPPRPADFGSKPSSDQEPVVAEHSVMNGAALSPDSVDDLIDSSLNPSQIGAKEWTWEMIETERQRGMKIAEHMAGLDKLKEEFTGDSKPALGAYKDLLWA